MEGVHFRFAACAGEENNQQPLLSHQALRPPPTPPTLVQNLHPVTCSGTSGSADSSADQSGRASSSAAAAAGLEHDSNCALNSLYSSAAATYQPRRSNTTQYSAITHANRRSTPTPEPSASASSPEVAQESVDLLRMLPDAHAPRESNPLRANRMYGPLSGGGSGSGVGGGGGVGGVQQGVHREADESAAEDSSGFCDDSVVYYTSIPCSHSTARSSLLGGGMGGGAGGGTTGGGGTSDPEERIAFLSSTYSTLNTRNSSSNSKRNNGGISLIDRARGVTGAGGGSSSGAGNVAEYCTSKSHSRSCGNLTCPRGYDKNRLGGALGGMGGGGGRSLKQIYPDYKKKRRKKQLQLRSIKRWTFLSAILLGIILAITGIIVAFLVYAPFHLGSKSELLPFKRIPTSEAKKRIYVDCEKLRNWPKFLQDSSIMLCCHHWCPMFFTKVLHRTIVVFRINIRWTHIHRAFFHHFLFSLMSAFVKIILKICTCKKAIQISIAYLVLN